MPSKTWLSFLTCLFLVVSSSGQALLGQSDASRKFVNERIKASKLNSNSTPAARSLSHRKDDDSARAPQISKSANPLAATVPAELPQFARNISGPTGKQSLDARSASFSKSKPTDEPPSDDADEENDNEAGEESEEGEEDDPEPWTIFQFPRLEQHDVRVRGWLAQGFTWNPDKPADRSNGVLGMNDRSNDYLFNQLGITIENPVEEDSCNWSVGWRVGLMYGADARFVQALGFDDGWNSGRFVALAIPELYTDVFLPCGNGASLRLGRFWTPIGYEGVPALQRFFHSATNAFMLAEPSTHTGALLKYPLTEQWTVQGGVVQGWDVWSDNNDSLGAIGALGWISQDERTTVTGVFYSGDETVNLDDDQFTYSFMLMHDITERWSYLFWNDFSAANDVAATATGAPKSGQWFSIINALFFAVDDRVSVGSRFEYYRDDDGVTIFHPITGDNLGPGDLIGLTFGVNYTPATNLLIRPEIRWDWANRAIPYDDQTDRQQFTGSFDVVWQF